MKIRNSWKRVIAASLAVLVVGGAVPADVGFGGLFGGTGIVASATAYNVAPVYSATDLTTFKKDDVLDGKEDVEDNDIRANYVTVKTTSGDVLADYELSWTADKNYKIMDRQRIDHSEDSQYSSYNYVAVLEYIFTVEPDVQTYPIWVGGQQLSEDNLSGEGWSYDAENAVLTLNNYEYSGKGIENASIFAAQDLTIELIGDNTVSNVADPGAYSMGIGVNNGGLTIKGEGTLTVNSGDTSSGNESIGISVGSDLRIEEGATVRVNSGNCIDGNTNAAGASVGVQCGNMYVDGVLEANAGPGGESAGVYVVLGKGLYVSGTLTAVGAEAAFAGYGIVADEISVSDNATVKAVAGKAKWYSYGIGNLQKLTDNGILEATGGDTVEEDGRSAGIQYIEFENSTFTVNNTLVVKGNDFAIMTWDSNNGSFISYNYTVLERQEVTESEYPDGTDATFVDVGETTADMSKYVKIMPEPKTFDVGANIMDGMSNDILAEFNYETYKLTDGDAELEALGYVNDGMIDVPLKSGNYRLFVSAPNYVQRFIDFTVGEDGYYEFSEDELRLFKKGDFNGDGKINYRDVLVAVQVANGKKQLNDDYLLKVLDVEGIDEGHVDYRDAMKLVQAAKGKINLWNEVTDIDD